MSLTKEDIKRYKSIIDNYIDGFDYILTKIHNEGRYRLTSEPYEIIGDYYYRLRYFDDVNDMSYYRHSIDVLIKQLYQYVSDHDDFELLLDDDLKFLLNEINEYLNQFKMEIKTINTENSNLFYNFEENVLELRDSFEYILIGLEYTKHFTVSQSVLDGLRDFDERFKEFISRVESETKHVILEDAPAPNPLNSRFWWRYK